MWSLVDSETRERERERGAVGTTESKTGLPLYEVQIRPNLAPARTGQFSAGGKGAESGGKRTVRYAAVNYPFQFSGPVTALRARAGDTGEVQDRLSSEPLNSQIQSRISNSCS